ncbi:hypothetical protein MAFF212519_17380 [Clavibacter michiganensis]
MQAPHAVGQAHRIPAVADHDDVEDDALLTQHRGERRRQPLRPAPLGEDDDADARGGARHADVSRREVTIITKCPTSASTASGSRTTRYTRSVSG